MSSPQVPTFPFAAPQVTIANGTSLSPAVYLGTGDLVAIQMPASWTAAGLSFQGSVDGVNFFNLFDAQAHEVIVDASAAIQIPMSMSTAAYTSAPTISSIDFRGCAWIKVRSGTSGSAVSQGADRILTMVIRKRLHGG